MQNKNNKKQYLNYLIDPSFQNVNRLSVLSFGNVHDHIKRERLTNYYLPKVEIKYKNVMIECRNFLDQPTENNIKTQKNI